MLFQEVFEEEESKAPGMERILAKGLARERYETSVGGDKGVALHS